MNLGDMDTRIQIQSPPSAKDDGGELSGSWSIVCTPWASLGHNTSSEVNDEGTEAVVDVITFTIRYRSGISSEMRILHDSNYYEIIGIREIGRNEYLELSGVHKTNW